MSRLPTSGRISLLDLKNEFGGVTPIKLGTYNRGGYLTTTNSENANVPTVANNINLNAFHGAKRYLPPGATGTANYDKAGTYTFTVPWPTTHITIQTVGAGGGGGPSGGWWWWYYGYNKSDRAGKAGQYATVADLAVEVGDVITMNIGAGGPGGHVHCHSGVEGSAGGSTAVYKNGVLVLAAAGGAGGKSYNYYEDNWYYWWGGCWHWWWYDNYYNQQQDGEASAFAPGGTKGGHDTSGGAGYAGSGGGTAGCNHNHCNTVYGGKGGDGYVRIKY